MTAISMDDLLRLAKQNGDLIREQNTAVDTATVMARLIDEADVVYAVWSTNPTDPGPTHFEAASIKGRHLVGQNIEAKVSAIAVNNEMEADLLRKHVGDGQNVN